MKKIFLLITIALLAISAASALEPIKVALFNTGAANVQVILNDYTGGTATPIYTGPSTLLTPNGSGIIIINIANNTATTDWADITAAQVNSYYVLDILVGGTLTAQYRLDQQIISQSQGGVFDNEGNLSPSTSGAQDLGNDDTRWGELFVEGNTIHVGPAGGMGTDELAFSYNDASNTATMTVAGASALTATAAGVTIPGTLNQNTGQVAFGGNVDMNDGLDVLTGNLNVGSTNVDPSNGNTLIGGTLQVTGTSTLNGNTSVSGANTFSVGTGQATFGGNLVMSNNASTISNSGGTQVNIADNIKLGNNNDLVLEGQSGILFNTTAPIRVEDDLAVGVSGGSDDKFYVSLGTGNTRINGTLDQRGAISNSTGDLLINDTFIANSTGNRIGNNTASLQLDIDGVVGTPALNVDGDLYIAGSSTLSGATTLSNLSGAGTRNIAVNPAGVVVLDESTVNTNTTISGDGSTGSPLGINLANANTWTGQQTFNSNTSVSGTNTFTVGTGATTLGGTLGVTGEALIDGLTIGQGAGNVATNSAIGVSTLAANTTGTNNTAIGNSALSSNTDGTRNTASGTRALRDNSTTNNNTATGFQALMNSTGNDNTAQGSNALLGNLAGSQNTASGYTSLSQNTTGSGNSAFGNFAGQDITTGSNNVFVGNNSGNNASQKVDAANSIAIGANTYTTADNQVVIGDANITETNLQGVLNVPMHAVIDGITVGQGAGDEATNMVIGSNALSSNTTGTRNTATGTRALRDNSTTSNNTATGFQALMNSTGNDNTAQGSNALLGNLAGSQNTASGYTSLSQNTTGSGNSAFGNFAGYGITTGSSNTFVGNNAGNTGQTATVSNSTAIGNGAVTTASNQVVIGNASVTATNLRGATLVDLAGGGTQNIQVDNTGKIITGGGGGGGNLAYTEVTANTTLNTSNQVVFITGNFTVTLPASPATGQLIQIYSESTTATLNPQSKVFRDGGADYGTSIFSDFTAGTNLSLYYNGTKWLPIGRR